MDKAKKRRLAKKGWIVGDAKQFLGLTDEEMTYIELKLAFSKRLRERRVKKHLTQAQLARQIKSSQSRVAKMEAGDPSVSIDLLIRSLIALGTSKKELAKVITASNLVKTT
jgi:DNA-binding XRE family transcriptional regulator